jgi:hypothetical protein
LVHFEPATSQPTTRRLLESILAVEAGHAGDVADQLQVVQRQAGP